MYLQITSRYNIYNIKQMILNSLMIIKKTVKSLKQIIVTSNDFV